MRHGKDAYQVAWTTKNEKAFITNMGRFNRSYLLRRYREAIAKRMHWGRVDRAAVLAHLDACERFIARIEIDGKVH